MLSKTVEAPAYFGESCLWIPLDDWDIVPPPMYMYSARCECRGELIVIDRQDIQELISKFGPWLAERFEYFREAVVEGYVNDGVGRANLGGLLGAPPDETSYRLPIPVDWAAADLDLPEQETIPVEAFLHMDALHRATCQSDVHPLRSGRRERANTATSISEQREEARANLQGTFKSQNSLNKNKDWSLPDWAPVNSDFAPNASTSRSNHSAKDNLAPPPPLI